MYSIELIVANATLKSTEILEMNSVFANILPYFIIINI